MASPEWRCVTAADGVTELRMLHHRDGGVSVKITTGATSAVAQIAASDLVFLARATAASEHLLTGEQPLDQIDHLCGCPDVPPFTPEQESRVQNLIAAALEAERTATRRRESRRLQGSPE